MDERFYTPKQVAEILQVHQYTVLKWIREGKLRALKLGRVYRTTESELRAFLGQTAHESAQEIMRSAAYTPDAEMVQTSYAPQNLPPHVSEPEQPLQMADYVQSISAENLPSSNYQQSSTQYIPTQIPQPVGASLASQPTTNNSMSGPVETYRLAPIADDQVYSVHLEP